MPPPARPAPLEKRREPFLCLGTRADVRETSGEILLQGRLDGARRDVLDEFLDRALRGDSAREQGVQAIADVVIEVRLGAAIGDNDQIERLVRLQAVLDDVIGTQTTVIDVSTSETTQR